MKRLALIVSIIIAIIFVGCSPISTRYVLSMPDFDEIEVTGIQNGERIIAVTDRIGDSCAETGMLYAITDSMNVYQINITAGEATPQMSLSYREHYYWDSYDISSQTTGEECFQTFMMGTCLGGKYVYGFSVERYLDCDKTDRALISFSREHREETWDEGDEMVTYVEEEEGTTLKFLINDDVKEVFEHKGYINTFTENNNVSRSRYYNLNDREIIGSVPDYQDGTSKSIERTDLFYIDLDKGVSWGADLDINSRYYYVDFAMDVSRESAFIATYEIATGKHYLWRIEPKVLAQNIQLYRTVN